MVTGETSGSDFVHSFLNLKTNLNSKRYCSCLIWKSFIITYQQTKPYVYCILNFCSPIYDTKDWSPTGDVYVGGKFFLHF